MIENTERGLDPPSWDEARAVAHRMVDDAIAYLQGVSDRPSWRDPSPVEAVFREALPRGPTPLPDLYATLSESLMPYPMGNVHPRFFAWYMGAGNFTGALGEFLAAVQGSNLGGGRHAAAMMDRQVVDWLREAVGFPAGSSGALVSGGSMANLMALAVARNAKAGIDVRALGVAALPRPLRYYASDQVHSCHRKALEALGLGDVALRRVPSDAGQRIDLDALRAAIAEDRRDGLQPACIIGTAGTVNTGAVDDLPALAEIARREDLWFHVDGCIGALLAVSPAHRHLVRGLGDADSVALDPHKWLHVPFEAGCVIVRDAAAHRRTFALTPEYLQQSPRGLASGEWLHEWGLQTSRGFRALKIWMTIKEHGIEAFGHLIDQNIALAQHLRGMADSEPELEAIGTAQINIVCFRYRADGWNEATTRDVNMEILMRLQEEGEATLSDTVLDGRHCLRAAVVSHRTRQADIDRVVAAVLRIGRDVVRERGGGVDGVRAGAGLR
ncbi:pyridoxal-dependent decarboxylase [uncultured Alsobacter sp.]|uniref:pyridoxal phosphate-dependent decarboxylase family protein n=1 Tax=uncultured Alsobacter sp. TaxID=1748258 RepID=UPI0025D6A95F|nr:pyridoxal-dependent decarboxylase [uncultured Alsobacter sp.]